MFRRDRAFQLEHQCVHRGSCRSRRCLGLNTAYVTKHGWHADLLVPLTAEEAR